MTDDKSPLLHLSNSYQLREVLAMPWRSVEVDWWGRKLEKPFRYLLSCDGSTLVFACEVGKPPPVKSRHTCGAFVEDLAEPLSQGDTAELFIMSGDGRYFELHVSPDGAWWYMEFSGYRTRIPCEAPLGVDVRTEWRADSWVGVLQVPCAELLFPKSSFERFQVSFALCSDSEPNYISSSGSHDFEPDFHDRRAFTSLV